jgi:predicted PurR-regulated permease PerM
VYAVRIPNPKVPLTRWREFRRAQRELLEASNHPSRRAAMAAESDELLEQSLLADLLGDAAPRMTPHAGPAHPAGSPSGSASGGASGGSATGAGAATTGGGATGDGARPAAYAHDDKGGSRFGEVGRPLNRHSPFYIGFVGAFGALLAIGLWHAFGRLATTMTILLVSLFLTLALNPLVEWLLRRKMPRAAAVGTVFLGLLVVFGLLGWLVIPPVITQGSELINKAPDYLQTLFDTKWVQELDKDYQVVDKFQAEFNKKITDQSFIQQVLGGILGAGRIVASGIFQTLTILILTLYFLASLPRMKQSAYAMVPASRRLRVVSLSEEIMRRVGSYAIGQVSIATINALCSYVMMSILEIPYAAVLAVAVGFLGLIPMVGATIGAVIVGSVAFFDEPRKALIVAIYYLIYQQIENYVFTPRIMQRTVSVPGALTVVAALAGGTLLGVLGALLAIPVAAGLLLLYEEVLVPRQRHS